MAHPFEVFAPAGIVVEYATPWGGKPHEDAFDEKDPAERAFRAGKSMRRMSHSHKLSGWTWTTTLSSSPADSARWWILRAIPM